MKKVPTPKRKLAISIVVLLLAAAVAIGGTVAIYTSQVFQRSVVRNRDTEAIRFSSDKLYRVATGNQNEKKYYYPMSQEQKTMSFTVCNYDQSKNAVVNQQDLEYSIKFEVKNGTEGFQYIINEDNNTTVSNGGEKNLNGTLAGGKRSTDTYTIRFHESDYNKVEVTVTVTPKDSSLTKDTILYATLIPIEYATTQGVQLAWEFIDGNDILITNVDAYNVAVSISGGEDDVVIEWENDKLDIDPFFLKKVNVTPIKNENKSTLTIHMNAEDDTAAYQFQFYKHGLESYNWNEWTDLPIQIYIDTTATDVPEQGVS